MRAVCGTARKSGSRPHRSGTRPTETITLPLYGSMAVAGFTISTVLPPQRQSRAALQRFQAEIEAAASLHHPNIVRVYTSGCAGDVYYFAMELVSGPTLGDLLQRLKDDGKENAAKEGYKIAIEPIHQVKEIEGVKGVHVMAIGQEDKVPDIVKDGGLYPRPKV